MEITELQLSFAVLYCMSVFSDHDAFRERTCEWLPYCIKQKAGKNMYLPAGVLSSLEDIIF